MAFNVNFYTFTKEVNSTARPSGSGTVFSCVSNADFNILAPRLPLQLGAAANPTAYNYCRVEVWGRYYWVSRWAFEAGLWVAYCEVDALASWKTEIGATSAYVLRAAADSDGNLVDTMYPTKTPIMSNVPMTDPWSSTYLDHCYVVGIVNGNSKTDYFVMTTSELSTFISTVFGDPFFTNQVQQGGALLKAEFNPMQYITTIMKFPVAKPDITVAGQIWLGYWNTGLTGDKITNRTHKHYTGSVTLPKHPQASVRGAYLNNSPYLNYTLCAPPFGLISVPMQSFVNEATLSWDVDVDFIGGRGIMAIMPASFEVVGLYESQVGCPMQLSQVMTHPMSAVTNLLSGVAAGLMGNIIGGVNGIINAAECALPTVQTTGINAGLAGVFTQPWALAVTTYPVADDDVAHRGRPLCQVRQLSTLSGYQLCTDTDIQIPATRQEIDTIRAYLESGYYYE